MYILRKDVLHSTTERTTNEIQN